MHPARYLRTKEASSYTGIAVPTLEKMRLTGNGPPFIKAGRLVTYDIADLDAWLASMKRASTSQS